MQDTTESRSEEIARQKRDLWINIFFLCTSILLVIKGSFELMAGFSWYQAVTVPILVLACIAFLLRIRQASKIIKKEKARL